MNGPASTPESDTKQRRPRILVVDDEPDLVSLCTRILQRQLASALQKPFRPEALLWSVRSHLEGTSTLENRSP